MIPVPSGSSQEFRRESDGRSGCGTLFYEVRFMVFKAE
jgi:hypothetical protein